MCCASLRSLPVEVRRSAERPLDVDVVALDGRSVDFARREITLAGGTVRQLSERETEILRYLVCSPGRAIAQQPYRIDAAGKYDPEYSNAHIVDQAMGRLMKDVNSSEDNPWDPNAKGYIKHVREGGEIFFQNCHFCHGDNLNGRGLWAFAFNPIPANFTDAGTIAQLQETFVFWRVAKGGIGLPTEGFPWASVMPPWEQHLTVDEIWKVVMFEYWHTGYYPRTWD